MLRVQVQSKAEKQIGRWNGLGINANLEVTDSKLEIVMDERSTLH